MKPSGTIDTREGKALPEKLNCGKLIVRDGWLMCPSCGKQRVLRIYPETRAKCLQVYCKRFGHEHIVNIDKCLCQSACAT